MWRSVRQTAHADTRMRTSPVAGSGTGRSPSSRGCPGTRSTIARTKKTYVLRRGHHAPMARAVGSAVAVRVARLLYRRWERLAPPAREQLEPLAEDVKQ